MSVINTNVKALYTQAALKTTDRASAIAMQQLSTGKRINSAKDDAAGMAIATRMTQQISSLNQAMRNAGDAVSLIQTAEGATNEITNMLQRMRELSIQSINDTNATDQRGYLDLEFQQLKQEIVRISGTTEWNGFPVLNGTTGDPVGARPVYKATSDGASTGPLSYTVSTTDPMRDQITISGSPFAKAGYVTVVLGTTPSSDYRAQVGTPASIDYAPQVGTLGSIGYTAQVGTPASSDYHAQVGSNPGTATATLTLSDGSTTSFPGVVTGNNVGTFTDSPLTGGTGSVSFTSNINFVPGHTGHFTINRAFTPTPPIGPGDILINGVTIGAPNAADDKISPADSASSSAIARAAAINLMTSATGVAAVVNTNVMTGSAMLPNQPAVSGSVTINGFTSAPILTTANNTRVSRAATVSAINAISAQTGVVAIDSNSDNQGIRLESAKGGNIEVAFNSALSSSTDFAKSTGLTEGLQVGTFSLETSVDGPLVVSTSGPGKWKSMGLRPADYSANQSVINTAPRAIVTTGNPIHSLGVGDLVINGVAIRSATSNDDKLSNTTSANSSPIASAIATAAAINDSHNLTGVTAKANAISITGSPINVNSANSVTTNSLYINGVSVLVDFSPTEAASDRLTHVVSAINAQQGQTGVLASDSGTGGVTLTTPDGRNLSVWYNSTTNQASEFGLANAPGVTGIASATATSSTAATLYGSISLTGDAAPVMPPPGAAPGNGAPPPYVSKTFTVEAGTNGFNAEGDFKSLGFQAGTFGGDVDAAASKMTPPRTGRMTFQVGSSANQTISIDLADFGKGGPITGAITADSGKTPPDVSIATAAGATAVLTMLDAAMDKVNGARATMGAVMNRLQHVIDNLSNVVVNTEASRSQIQDADYAAASSELSRTSIMKQAATAVLAQANTDQQSVLKLLQ